MDLQSGQNVAVGSGRLQITLTCEPASQRCNLDLCAFLLDAGGHVMGDGGFVFYGQLQDPSGSVLLNQANAAFEINPKGLPNGITQVVLAVNIDTEQSGSRTFGQFKMVALTVRGDGGEFRFPLATTGMPEIALIMAELYLRNGTWKLRALGQGFAGGLAPLARNYGVDVRETGPKPTPLRPIPPSPSAPPPAPSPAAPPARIDLRKREPVSLEKPTRGFGEIKINLNWSRGQVTRGFFGRVKGGIDLDLGCMVELADNNKFVVQALGNSFGRLDSPPYAKLLGDDRSGDSASGETLLINGKYWQAFRRVLIYAFIYEGVPNWSSADGVVTVTAPGIPELIVRLDESATGKNMCGIAMLENDGGRIRVTKLIEYFTGHDKLDDAYGFGFRWVAGHK